jgi:hypothetical protein
MPDDKTLEEETELGSMNGDCLELEDELDREDDLDEDELDIINSLR